MINEIGKLISFYEDNKKKHEENIQIIDNKDETPTAKMYSETNKRYSEGFRDATELILKDLYNLKKNLEDNK